VKLNFGGSAAGISTARPKGFSDGAWRMATTAESVTRAAGGGAGVTTGAGGGGIAAAGGTALVGTVSGAGAGTGLVSGGGAGGSAGSVEGVGAGVGETARSSPRPVPAASVRTPANARREKIRRLIEMSAKYSEM
jgi:hypothetical protein